MMETATTRRPWESKPSFTPSQTQTQTQTLPSIRTLTRDVDSRTSDNILLSRESTSSWTGTNPILSTSSITPTNTMPFLTSPTNHSPTNQPQSYHPTDINASSTGYASNRNSIIPGQNIETNQHRGSGDFDNSRRGSVDGRIYQGMDSLRLGGGPTSPYNASANASQSSLASSLQQQRGIQANGIRLSSGPISPHWSRNGTGRGVQSRLPGRIAPPILEDPRSENRFATEPVRGQAWAFPDPDAQPTSPSARAGSTISRRNSQASSFTNSIYSELCRPLPPGQHELPDHHHHTSMPTHERIQYLKGDPDSPTSATPYSRTPELRVTHKLAERKRRSEMKDCFEQLRNKLPVAQNNKSSKWETLARAIDYIQQLEGQNKSNKLELDHHREQMHQMEIQIKELTARMNSSGYPAPPSTMPSNPVNYASNSHYVNGEESRTLPPLINGGAMQGVQYGEGGR